MVTYAGSVTVGGTPDVRELTHLTITKVAVDKEHVEQRLSSPLPAHG